MLPDEVNHDVLTPLHPGEPGSEVVPPVMVDSDHFDADESADDQEDQPVDDGGEPSTDHLGPPSESDNGSGESAEGQVPAPVPNNKRWYVVKVQSGREESIKEAIERRVKIEGLEEFFGQIIIPVEISTEMRRGKRVRKETKLFPGYLMVEVEYNDRILYLFRETSGVGDFVGHTIVSGVTRPPVPMSDREVERMLHRHMQPDDPKVVPTIKPSVSKPKFDVSDRLRVTDGTFQSMEGDVLEINQEDGKVKLRLTIIGRPMDVDLEFWQVEKV